MALNLPMPNIANSFSGLSDNLMKQLLARQQMQKQQERFAQELAFKKENEARMASQFQKDFGLRQQAESRLGQSAGLNRQLLQQQVENWKHKNDPGYALKQLQQKLDFIANLNSLHGGQNPQNPPQEAQEQQEPQKGLMDIINQGQEYSQGEGALSAENEPEPAPMGNPEPQFQQQPQAQPKKTLGGLDMDTIKQALTYQALGLKVPTIEKNVLHGPARDASDLEKLKKKEGENSEVYQNAKAAYDAQVDAKKDLRDLRARTKAGLKVGEKEFFDKDTGVPLGKEIPLTAAERQSEEGNILFNELYPYVYKGASPFSGEGSITRLENAASHYKTDPKARKLFDDFLLADKMLAATTVNESATLKAGKTNRTYNMLKESLEAQDIPNIVKKLIKQFEIPSSAQLKASMRYQKALSDARKKARKGTPATQKLFYDPEQQAKNEQNIAEGNIESKESNKKEIKKIGDKTYEKINGEWYESE